MSTWRNCLASVYLVNEVNTRFPQRDKSSDGTVGDPAHAARVSDHNPNQAGVVRARDIDEDLGRDITGAGWDMPRLVAHLRQLAIGGDARLNGGGYIIYEGRICGGSKGWDWRPYTGSNPHDKHAHISFSKNAAAYDSRAPWGIAKPFTPPSSPKGPLMALTDAEQKELLDKVRKLHADYGVSGKGVRQVIAEIAQRTKDLVSGARPS